MSPIHYPKGMAPKTDSNPLQKKKVRKSDSLKSSFKIAPGNRGMSFEAMINDTNAYYKEKGLCLVTKRPTPIKVLNVDYEHGPRITNAFYEKQSTTDYNGVFQGHYLDFEAKETQSRTSFPLANIPSQQIEHLKAVIEQGGIAFFLIHFAKLHETYLLPADKLIAFKQEGSRASLPYETIKKEGRIVLEGIRPRLDYLPVLRDVFAL